MSSRGAYVWGSRTPYLTLTSGDERPQAVGHDRRCVSAVVVFDVSSGPRCGRCCGGCSSMDGWTGSWPRASGRCGIPRWPGCRKLCPRPTRVSAARGPHRNDGANDMQRGDHHLAGKCVLQQLASLDVVVNQNQMVPGALPLLAQPFRASSDDRGQRRPAGPPISAPTKTPKFSTRDGWPHQRPG
jgi:hypothetical protein